MYQALLNLSKCLGLLIECVAFVTGDSEGARSSAVRSQASLPSQPVATPGS